MEQNPIINSTMKKLIDQMENGKKSTQILRNILNQWPRLKVEAHDHHDDGVDYFKALDHHCMVALTSCVTSLSLMRSFELNSEISSGKRKINHDLDDDDHAHDDDQIKHEDLYEEVTNLPTITKNKRGCYRRRKSGDGRVEEVTHLRDDGYAWRKYGQKVILNTNHPRYFIFAIQLFFTFFFFPIQKYARFSILEMATAWVGPNRQWIGFSFLDWARLGRVC
ncbi:hypothetical protein RND81_05G020600 [Saponaria officinalis]|uniref:WRKY domain-containing protein n=1 Tax=Saponaria officinalis TaxID=3572 RepID=A0AAW1KU00_SAPOF